MTDSLITLALVAALAALSGALFAHIRAQRLIGQLREENASLRTTVALERRHRQDHQSSLQETRDELTQTFSNLSEQALRANTEEFLKMAQENLQRFQAETQGGQDQSIQTLLEPVQEALAQTQQELREIERERKQAYSTLSKHLESMAQTHQQLEDENRHLAKNLQHPQTRDQWGRTTLQRLVELADANRFCKLASASASASAINSPPAMVARLPDAREIVVDVAAPIDAYLGTTDAPDNSVREWHTERHARQVREHIRQLSSRQYWSQFKVTPEFVVMLIPGDSFLTNALEVDQDLLEYALRHRIILATPTNFLALLRAVGHGWRQQSLAKTAAKLRDLGDDMYQRLASLTEHLDKLGDNLHTSLENYNLVLGSFKAQSNPRDKTAKAQIRQLDNAKGR